MHGKKVLVVFPDPHAYISASCYNEKNTIPTWNYVSVHVYGTFTLMETKEELVTAIEKTVKVYESSLPHPWNMNAHDPFIDGLLNGIVGFEISINEIEEKWKLSQNRSIQRQHRVIHGLKTTNQYHSQEIAKMMEENLKR
ncbi:FMN-binding negative transcriptional regulator [Thermaerobacillus caldiproteolyticus]|uniref:FMN-binding negative transcriptional regulator n=1 Tax=Thermaerobacillus caldiproteolyticus TaxID=247480 RepID=UPI00286811D1|nr:FMN-binding negative transcriptional regulator [Anoxybacillus caldiproteolyticus]